LGNIRILVVDDHALMRKGLVEIIARQPDLEVVGEAQDGSEALQEALRCSPDVVLLDVQMPVMDGLETLGRIRSQNPEARVIMLTMHDADWIVLEAIRRGAAGYLLKDCWPEELVRAIRLAYEGRPVVAPAIVPTLLEGLRKGERSFQGAPGDELSDDELKLLDLVAKGYTNKGIAEALSLSVTTVRHKLTVIFQKLHVSNRAEAVAWAYEKRLLPR
jgi:two-component system response regulator NreC